MPRRQDSLLALYADFNGRNRAELEAAAKDTRERLQASTRADMAGAPLNAYLVPQTYQQRVQMVWAGYAQDPLFGRLVNRFIEFAANGSQWEVPADASDESWIERIDKGRGRREDREEDVWNLWSKKINTGVPNVIPGLNEVVRWAVKHLLLSGMFIPHWEYGEMKMGKQTYLMPMRLTCHPASAITLRRPYDLFVSESILLFRPTQAASMQEGQFIEAPSFSAVGTSLPANMIELPQLGNGRVALRTTEAFALKYNWSPGDITGVRRGQVNVIGSGLYPLPPFFSLLPQLALRQKLFASDAAILDALINFIMLYKIGDKDHPPKPAQKTSGGTTAVPGTLEQVRALIQEGRIGPAMELFVPYYVNLEIKTPDTGSLLSDAKYGPSATEILQAFGIFFARTQSGARQQLDKMNMTGFEEFIDAIRWQVKAFLELLAAHVVEVNEGKLKTSPQWSPNPLNTKSDAFIQSLMKMKDVGMISAKTMFRYLGMDDEVELRRIARELGVDADDLFNENVPLSYVQQAIQPDSGGKSGKGGGPAAPGGAPGGRQPKPKPATEPGGTARTRKTTAIPRTKQRGRPKGSGKTPPADE